MAVVPINNCGICLNPLDQRVVSVCQIGQASHEFHINCIEGVFNLDIWADRVPCPLCRRNITHIRPLLSPTHVFAHCLLENRPELVRTIPAENISYDLFIRGIEMSRERNNIAFLQSLMSHVRRQFRGIALYEAISRGLEGFKSLVIQSGDCSFAYSVAAETGRLDVMQILEELIPISHVNRINALLHAVWSGHQDVLTYLIVLHNIDRIISEIEFSAAFRVAMENGRLNSAEILLFRFDFSNKNILLFDMCLDAIKNNKPEFLKLFLDKAEEKLGHIPYLFLIGRLFPKACWNNLECAKVVYGHSKVFQASLGFVSGLTIAFILRKKLRALFA